MGRILGLDWGKRRIGLALTDETRLAVRGLPTLERTHREADFAALEAIVREHGVTQIVLGRPLHMDGRPSGATRDAMRFGKQLAARCGVELTPWDERLTSVEAEQRWRERNPRQTKVDKAAIDRISAEILLEGYLAECGAS